MKKVIIFGTGKAAETLIDILNDEVDIIAYADNNKEKWNHTFQNKLVIAPSRIQTYEFDYILIASQYESTIYNQLMELKVTKDKIFMFYQYIDNCYDYVESCIRATAYYSEKIETLVTGISYAQYGFLQMSDVYKRFAFNMANASQDLYYDYNLVKYCLENSNLKKVKEVLIGLSYYSFQYDMSLSSLKNKGSLYYKNLRLYHHNESIVEILDSLEISEKIAQQIIKLVRDGKPSINPVDINYIVNEEVGKQQSYIDCKKNYPKTVIENTQIFKDYLQLLKENNIKPVVVVFPASKYYTKHFLKRIEDEFHKIINEVSKEYEFQYIDYFKSDLFDDDDFRDVTHLNKKGAEKFIKILNDLIE
ncbi:nucleoside-diphosphate sugar epimerase/dehydratase [Inconstantimicrobium mannanitabidum]|uniref:Chemotaxis protein n=1 Tax=Inconstantimicrobium mannanitabidum TaxID=1604901 RepID=A0ACB5R8M3_9CLOT|nr:chemotaxis protein [Clostridium sp. TW13]GKX65535.1 chemotaxis protein [Clostridium sp. TW13]